MVLADDEIERLDNWIIRVNALKLRFPVAVITKKTGFDKGYVSKLLKKKIQLSSNFLKKFDEIFYPIGVSNDSESLKNELKDEGVLYGFTNYKEKYYEQLEATNKVLQQHLNIIESQQQTIYNLTKGNVATPVSM